jgi:hypothetical protein
MKFLDNNDLSAFTAHLDGLIVPQSNTRLSARIELYSCKAAGVDKKLEKVLAEKLLHETATGSLVASPQDYSTSPFGPLTTSSSRKTLIHLIATLNASYPDYDFTYLRPDDFGREPSCELVKHQIFSLLSPCVSYDELNSLWRSMDTAVTMHECELYSYSPDPSSDLAQGHVWTFDYFWYNRPQKKVLYFAASAESLDADDAAVLAAELDDDLLMDVEMY